MIEKNDNLKTIFKGLFIFLIFIVYQIFGLNIYSLLGIDILNAPIVIRAILSLFTQLLLITIFILINLNDIKDNAKDFIKNGNSYFKKYFKLWLLSLSLIILTNLIIGIFTSNGLPNNEKAIRDTFDQAPIYTYIAVVFIAPILEELVFRKGFRMAIKNDLLFIILSGIIFGSLHVVGTFEELYQLLYIIPYSIPGIILAYAYLKSKNIFVPIFLHFMHNGFIMSLLIFLSLFPID